MFPSSRSSYSLPRTSSYVSTSRYSTTSKSSLPPLSGGYSSSSRFSSFSSSSDYSPRTSSYTNYSSTYKPLTETKSWRSGLTSPSLVRKDLTTSVSSRPSYRSEDRYRSGSVSSFSSSSSVNSYRSSSAPAYIPPSKDKDLWTPKSYRSTALEDEEKPSTYKSSRQGSSISPLDSNTLAGKVGLYNLGNTCFMNAVLQCLSHTKPLVDYCRTGPPSSDINHKSSTHGELIEAFSALVKHLWRENATNAVSPDSVKRELQKYAHRFSGYSQQDAQELLRYLLQGLHNDLNRVRISRSHGSGMSSEAPSAAESWRRYQSIDDSKIVDIFAGQLKSTLTCTECNNVSITYDPFWDLSLPIPETYGKTTLQQCFHIFTSVETLDGREKPVCERCKKKTRSTKQFKINRFPLILVIHLKRFSSDSNYRSKLDILVDFPVRNLDLSEYATNGCSNSSSMYNLYGVVEHYGTSSSGHYIAKCKSPNSGEWNEFNDSSVSETSTSSVVSEKGYLLFYEQARHGWSSRL